MKTRAKPAKKKPARARRKTVPRREFTVRDLNRRTAELLDAARTHGSVVVRSRGGEQFTVSNKPASDAKGMTFAERMQRHRERLAATGYLPPSKAGWEVISRAIAGE